MRSLQLKTSRVLTTCTQFVSTMVELKEVTTLFISRTTTPTFGTSSTTCAFLWLRKVRCFKIQMGDTASLLPFGSFTLAARKKIMQHHLNCTLKMKLLTHYSSLLKSVKRFKRSTTS